MWKKIAPTLIVAALAGLTALPAAADDLRNALGGALGGAGGAAVGGAIGGQTGSVIGGAIGGGAGGALTANGHERKGAIVGGALGGGVGAAAGNAKVGTVIGGGLLGLEAAKALQDLGLKTHVVEFAPRLMAVQLDDSGGRLLRHKIEALEIGRASCRERV